MYIDFAWRYFKAKKSANAINLISWVTVGVIAFATCCQILVLSVFNGFEDLVKSLYSSFYTDLKIIPATGKTFILNAAQLTKIHQQKGILQFSLIAEEKALLQNGDAQVVLHLKGVDMAYPHVSGVANKMIAGKYAVGTADNPLMVVGSGIQRAAGIMLNPAFGPEQLTIILPKANVTSNDPLESLSEGIIQPSGSFSIQQDFDNSYAITHIDFVKQQMGMKADEFSAVEIKLNPGISIADSKDSLQKKLGDTYLVQGRYEQNTSLYNTMKTEKWAIYALLTLILIIAAFNMISALTMLVLEKKQDIAILQSMGSTSAQIRKIFLSEGLLLGGIGTMIGVIFASLICFIQLKFKIIKIQGGSFLIDYFPVKLIATDFLLVMITAMLITVIASWLPANKASRQPLHLK